MKEEGLKISVQNSPSGQFRRPGEKIISRRESKEKKIIPLLILCGILFLFYYTISNCVDVADHMTSVKPEIGVESVYVCPITVPNKADLWVLTFNITNLNNYTLLCIDCSEATLFSNNGTDLLAKGDDLHRTWVGPLSHTSMNMTFITEEPNQSDWSYNESIRFFDLKLTARFIHTYHWTNSNKMGVVVCRDAKLVFSTSSSNSSSSSSSCGAMMGDPPQCSFEFYLEY